MNNQRQLFKKSVAWALIAAMVNPALIAPAFARDTDIFLSVTSGASTAEPNILISLGTNDRMNSPEPWREYAGAYDSHVEYLWNDINRISNSAVAAENANAISTAVPPANPFSVWGFWSGATLTDRQNLWNAAKTYANATEPGDPGPRNTWRNYNDLSLLYWVPSTASITDARLRSVSLNTFRGYLGVVPGVRGGINFTANNPYPIDGSVPGGTPAAPYDFRALNQCASSLALLTPSTVFAPSTAPANAGMMLNQQWVRYEKWLDLSPINLSGYPGTPAQGGGGATAAGYYRGYLDSTVAPTQVFPGFPVPPLGPAGTAPTNTYRDNDRVGTGVLGMPIRVPTSGGALTSHAGWTDLKADSGGFELLYRAYYYQYGNSVFSGNPAGLLSTLRSVYGYPLLSSGDPYDEVLSAYKGTRDATTPVFGMTTGTPGYYDRTYGNCDPTTGPLPNTSPTNTTCINVAVAGAPAQNANWRRDCTVAGAITSELDANNTTRYRNVGLSCTNNGAVVCTFDPMGYNCLAGTGGPFGDRAVALPVPTLNCGLSTQNNFFTRRYTANCSFSGQTPVTVNTCQWSGRQSVFIEGQGTYFYGGSCEESGLPNSCSAGGSTLTLNGTPQSNVMGPYVGVPPSNGTTTLACGNAIGAGTYNYGGTCGGGTEYTVSTSIVPYPANPRTLVVPTDCAPVSGGVTLNIRGTGNITYNQTCTGLGDQNQTCTSRYGAACPNGATPAAVCPTNVTTTTVGLPAGSATNRYYQVYKLQESESNLVHDCLADQPAFNPGANTYMTALPLAFGTAASSGYTTTAAQAVTTDSAKNINVYSVNYLNWRFGAKACRTTAGVLVTSGAIPADATCTPIGRKTRLQIAKDALSGLVQATDGVRFGLMVNNRTAATLSNDGANIAAVIKRMGSNSTDTPAYNNRATLINAINAVVASSRTPLTESLYEAYRYYSGRAPVWGTDTATALIGGQVSAGRDTAAICTTAGVGTGCTAVGNYKSPMLNNPDTTAPAGCQKNFIINITNGQPEDDWSGNTAIKSMSYAGTLGTVSPRTTIDSSNADTTSDQLETSGAPYGPVDLGSTAFDDGYVWLDELSYFMSRADVSPGAQNFAADTPDDKITGRQAVITYTIGFAGINSQVVANAANNSGGVYYLAEDSAALSAALTAAIVAIREWNPTVASPTVPISALNRSENASDIYLAFFQPDPSQAWLGTVKKFQLGTNETDCGTGITLCLNGQTVLSSGNKNIEKLDVDPVTGATNIVVDPNAVSFWNPTAETDGGKPDEGGTGYQLLNTTGYDPSTRNIYTFLANGVSSTTVLSNSTNRMLATNAAISKTLLGNPAMSDATREMLINFIRGGNPGSANCSDGDTATLCTAWRAWAHFDVQHSKPTIVTYDATASPATQYMFYLSGDGLLHAIDTDSGKEKWAYLIEEALPKITQLQADTNGPQVDIADGSPVIFTDDANGDGIISGSDRVWLFFSLRRGGRTYYALDISSKDAPIFKWKISAAGGTGKLCTATTACASISTYSELGESWSSPAIGRIRALGTSTPALIFGGGYDTAEDTVPPTTRTMGRALYVVNADTGIIVNSFGQGQSGAMLASSGAMNYPVPSDVTAINTDLDAQGYLDRIYVGDTGGNLWRFDINDPTAANWRGKKLANLSDSGVNGHGEKRKILFQPAVVKQNSPIRFDAVYVGTGDREHPILTQSTTPPTTTDKIFMVMDRDYGLAATDEAPVTFDGAAFLEIDDTDSDGITSADLNSSAVGGWYRNLENGEKVVNAPTVFFNKLRFGTYAPLSQSNACAPPGEGRLNEIDALTGAYFNLNGTLTGTAADRYYASFITRGYVSSGQLIVVGTNVYHITVSDARLQSTLVGTIGSATKIYWYMEPEQ